MNRRAWLAVTALLALTAACGPAEGPGVDDTVPGDDAVHYVALGDSYTAAPGTGEPVGTPRGCGRSDNNYPRLLADRLAPESFTDVSCGGATTEHLTAPQRTPDGTNPPQLDAVTPKTTLVTVGIGGNDVGFVELANRCASAAEEGLRCSDAVAGGDGTLNAKVEAVATKVSGVLDAIEAKAPDARVVVVGYPTILPEDPTVCDELLIDPADLSSLREGLELLNHILQQQASAHGAEFADTATGTEEHHVCAAEDSRWIEALESTTGAAPLHPTARGEQAMADAVLAVLRGR
ncbi:MAG: SGNH/GDSL hydrolase family protein [Saccharomonospora viridis]|uniref:SGNH/GDSL hydrolase family protein n=1 Tax=Saccharomonospora viridis TaxID=1852 RepID=UPI003D8A6F16